MNSLNKVQLIGNTTAAPEVKETPNGQKVAAFSIATNRVWKDTSGEKQEAVDFHNVVAWGKLAEIIERYLEKGKKVYVEGRLTTRSWEDQTGAKRYKTEIVAENVILLSGKSEGSARSESSDEWGAEEEAPRSAPKKKAARIEEEIHIEDIPF